MDGGVTACGPAGAAIYEYGMIHFANEKLAGLIRRALHLHVAFEAKIIVAFREKLTVYRAVRVVARGASFAHRFVFVNEGA